MRVPRSVLAAVGVLAVNDHVLKAAHPGWVTGKLSDAAGLVAAPWLLAQLLRPLAGRQAARLSVGLVGVGFAAMKVVPAATAAFELVLDAVAWPSNIVTDPTDLLALPALVLGARAVGVEARPGGLLVPAALSIGLVTTTATSCIEDEPAFPFRIDVVDGRVVGQSPIQRRANTSAVDPTDPSHEYRLVVHERVEERIDGGAWRVAFEIPEARRPYMERYEHEVEIPTPGGCGVDPSDIDVPSRGFEDLAVRAHEGGTEVLVAMGNQGLLRRDVSGTWHRERMLDGRPTPLKGGLDGLEWELVIPFPLVAMATIAFAGFGWGLAPPGPLSRHRALRTAAVSGALLVAAMITATAWPPGALIPLAGLVVWATARSRVALIAAVCGVIVPLLAIVPWLLWSVGTIESYDVATTLALAILVIGFGSGAFALSRLRPSVQHRTDDARAG